MEVREEDQREGEDEPAVEVSAVAAVAKATDLDGLGIDVAHHAALPEGVLDQVANAAERAWPAFAVDEKLGLVYIPTGNPSPDQYGVFRRPFDEKYGSAIVALTFVRGEARA